MGRWAIATQHSSAQYLDINNCFNGSIIDSCNGKKCQVPQEIVNLYCNNLDNERLTTRLSMLPDLTKTIPVEGELEI